MGYVGFCTVAGGAFLHFVGADAGHKSCWICYVSRVVIIIICMFCNYFQRSVVVKICLDFNRIVIIHAGSLF